MIVHKSVNFATVSACVSDPHLAAGSLLSLRIWNVPSCRATCRGRSDYAPSCQMQRESITSLAGSATCLSLPHLASGISRSPECKAVGYVAWCRLSNHLLFTLIWLDAPNTWRRVQRPMPKQPARCHRILKRIRVKKNVGSASGLCYINTRTGWLRCNEIQ